MLSTIRLCPNCGKVIQYKNVASKEISETRKTLCSGCSLEKRRKAKPKFFRNCPECGKTISYTQKDKLDRASLLNTRCIACCERPGSTEPWTDTRKTNYKISINENRKVKNSG